MKRTQHEQEPFGSCIIGPEKQSFKISSRIVEIAWGQGPVCDCLFSSIGLQNEKHALVLHAIR